MININGSVQVIQSCRMHGINYYYVNCELMLHSDFERTHHTFDQQSAIKNNLFFICCFSFAVCFRFAMSHKFQQIFQFLKLVFYFSFVEFGFCLSFGYRMSVSCFMFMSSAER